MNSHLLQVFRYEFRRTFRRGGYLFMTFGLPVLGIVALAVVVLIVSLSTAATVRSEDGGSPFEVEHAGYVDLSGMFSDPGPLADRLTRYPDEESAQAAMASGQIEVYYLIPADYLESGEITAVMPQFSVAPLNEGLIKQLVVHTLTRGVDPALLERLQNPARFEEINLERTTTQEYGTSYALVYAFGMMLVLGMFTTSGYLMQSIIEEKETRLIEILISSLRPFELLAGKVLAYGLLGLLQLTVWLGTIFALIALAGLASGGFFTAVAAISIPPLTVVLVLVYFILGYLVFAASMATIGGLSTSQREGPQYSIIFTLPAIAPLWFINIFLETPNDSLPVALSLFPLTAPMAMVERLALTNVPLWQIAVSLALLVLTVIGTIWLAARLFRVQTLLAGQLPKLQDIPKLVRG
jgi:ABC-2 type transport system permease protein